MNKFLVFPCVKQNNMNGYNGSAVMLACSVNINYVLYFPMSDENAALINYILDKPATRITIDSGSVLGVYRTMLDSLTSGDRFLSGIFMDTELDPESQREDIIPRLIISDEHGAIDAIVRVNFVHAVIIAAMERKEILISKEMLQKLIPIDKEEKNGKNEENVMTSEELTEDEKDTSKQKNKKEELPKKSFPVDSEILDIAKKIMSGKIKL